MPSADGQLPMVGQRFRETRLASNNTCYMLLVSQSAQCISCPRISLTTNIEGGLNAFLISRPLEM
jgi:thioredoxin-related protein